MSELYEAGLEAALLVWADDPKAGVQEDPRRPEFAEGVLAGLTQSLKSAPGVMKRVVRHAGAAAEDLNVDAFQGLVEVLQNADDLGATSVRFAIGPGPAVGRRLLVVHDGVPVTYPHVLAMMLPYLTTKSGDADQKGRFGIGLKTLKRISTSIRVHSAPYHFTADGLDLFTVPAAAGVPGFYDPDQDTLFELDLVEDFSTEALAAWFATWSEDDLLFLRSVRAFSHVDLESGATDVRRVQPGEWRPLADAEGDLPALTTRIVEGSAGTWILFRAEIATPTHLGRSHKATGAVTVIQIAVSDHDHPSGLFIGFRTRIPVSLPFSIDAQFDPSTTRESLISVPWNRWLIARCGDVVAAVAIAELARAPVAAWRTMPLSEETVGIASEAWPAPQFGEAFAEARDRIGRVGALAAASLHTALDGLAYESPELSSVLSPDDILRLAPDHVPLPEADRDSAGRWREILEALGVSRPVTPEDLARGFDEGLFHDKPPAWWVRAGDVLIATVEEGVFGTAAFLTDGGEARAVRRRGETARGLVVGETLSDFAGRWALFERLHDAYRSDPEGERVLTWLLRTAAVSASVDAADELNAFAEAFAEAPIYLDAADVVALRDRFDMLSDVRAAPLGARVGRSILLDGQVFRNGKRASTRMRPSEAYLGRTLDGEHPYWPEAAAGLPQISWLSSGYDVILKTGATRTSRKRADGTMSRGPRKFLVLLGAACAPRLLKTDRKDWGRPARVAQLKALGAEFTPFDYVSPDLDRVLSAMDRLPRKQRRDRSAALLKCLNRYWPAYAGTLKVPAYHLAIKHVYDRGEVASDWFGRLSEVAWVAVGTGALRVPGEAVVKTSQTQTIYASEDFIAGITADDLRSGMAAELKIITDVRASDLVAVIEGARAAADGVDAQRVLGAYRSLAKLCPNPAAWNSKVGDLTVADLRRRFSDGTGLILAPAADGAGSVWRRPDELFTGKDVFLDPARFVPGGPSLNDLWATLQVRKPSLDDCILALRDLSQRPYGGSVEAALIELYRYIEPLVAKADRRQRERLRTLPVGALNSGWARGRPVYHVENRELRGRLADARADLRFWAPPCDIHALPNVTAALGLTRCRPVMTIATSSVALELGEVSAPHFRHCVDHLSNELTRNDPVTRGRMVVTWSELRETRLSIWEGPFQVSVDVLEIPGGPIRVPMRAVLETDPLRLHIDERALAQRENGGRAIASLFPHEAQRRIEAEWVASWHASGDEVVERIATASDEEHARAMADRAQAAAAAVGAKIKVSTPASRSRPTLPPRRLKSAYGPVGAVTVIPGRAPTPAPAPRSPALSPMAPPASLPAAPPTLGPAEYNNLDLEQQGWEILSAFLNASEASELVDFRKRHGVGADGVIAWKTFVELKATGLGPQTSVEMSATEFERAKQRGLDFIIALVSGMEEGEKTEIRLIIDPANRADVRPIGAVRLAGLTQCAAISVKIDDVA